MSVKLHNRKTETTIESVFGVNAVSCGSTQSEWSKQHCDLVKATVLRRKLVYGALGWLGRENEITLEQRSRTMGVIDENQDER